MEALIRYISKNRSLQDQIVQSSNGPLIEATYRLLLHYGCPLDHFIKSGFRFELEVQGAGSIFREHRKMNLIITDFFQKFGGSFDYIIKMIGRFSLELKLRKTKKPSSGPLSLFDPKSLNKVLLKCIDLLEDQLASVISDSLVDFCSEVCLAINTQADKKVVTGEGIVCSFIVFRILAPRLLEGECCEGTTPDRIKEVVKGLSRISIGDTCIPDKPTDKFILAQNARLRNIVARALMKRRGSPYCYTVELSGVKYAQYTETLLDELSHLKGPQDESLDRLLKAALTPKRITSIACDLRYFVLWGTEEVLTLVEMQGLDKQFFKRWNINGANFVQLDDESLRMMGLDDKDKIKDVLRCVSDIKEFALSREDLRAKGLINWSIEDVAVWLTLSGLSDLIGIFRTELLDGKALTRVKVDDLCKIGITRPDDIVKIMRLIRDESSRSSSPSETNSSSTD